MPLICSVVAYPKSARIGLDLTGQFAQSPPVMQPPLANVAQQRRAPQQKVALQENHTHQNWTTTSKKNKHTQIDDDTTDWHAIPAAAAAGFR